MTLEQFNTYLADKSTELEHALRHATSMADLEKARNQRDLMIQIQVRWERFYRAHITRTDQHD